jgi:folylpolyglutamate synthase
MRKEGTGRRVLIFNCTSGRSARALLEALLDAGRRAWGDRAEGYFDQVVFCTNVTYTDGGFKGGKSMLAIEGSELMRCGRSDLKGDRP